MKPHISVVTPVYGARDCLEVLYERLVNSLATITENFEIIMVNDACPYGSWEVIEQLCLKDKRVKGINLYRNFGQHVAITAGVHNAEGDWVVVMDCDLQDQPEDIPSLYKKALEGNEVVFGVRGKRKDTLFKRFTSRVYQYIFVALSDIKNKNNNANFSIISKRVAGAYNLMNERGRGYFIQIHWICRDICFIDVNHDKRYAGESSYSLLKLIRMASSGLVANSYRPLLFASFIGIFMIFLSFLIGIKVVMNFMFNDVAIAGWSSLMIVSLLTSGIILFNLSVMSMYIWKTFEEAKDRPLYLIKEIVNKK